MKNIIKYAATMLTLAGVALGISPSYAQAGGWANIQPGYDAKARAAIVRFEGGAPLGPLTTYGFIDAAATTERPLDFENFYTEGRLVYKPGALKGFGSVVELNAGNGMEDLLRVGASYTFAGKGNFTFVKAFPYETTGERGPQLSVFSAQDVGKRLNLNLLADWNIKPEEGPGTIYIEAGVNLKVAPNDELFLQGRTFMPVDSIDDKVEVSPVVGWKHTF